MPANHDSGTGVPAEWRMLLPVHYTQHLFPDILCSFQCSNLHKILITPSIGELVVFPGVVHCK